MDCGANPNFPSAFIAPLRVAIALFIDYWPSSDSEFKNKIQEKCATKNDFDLNNKELVQLLLSKGAVVSQYDIDIASHHKLENTAKILEEQLKKQSEDTK